MKALNHFILQHSHSEFDKLGNLHKAQKSTVIEDEQEKLPNIHRVASLLKRWLLGRHQSYLNKKTSWVILRCIGVQVQQENIK